MASLWNPQISWVADICICWLLYCVATVVYRLYFSPLSKFPGPKLAAATLWYEAYYDVVKRGQYTFKIRELHEKYGPIVRVSPFELHINDPDYYDTLYARTAPRNKYKRYTDQFGIPKASFSTIDHYQHRMRRQAQASFFSKKSILRLEPIFNEMINKLCTRMDEFRVSGKPMPIRLGYQCLTTDIITLYAMNKSWDFLDSPDFSPGWFETIKVTGEMGHIVKQIPWIYPVMKSLPTWLVSMVSKNLGLILIWKDSMTSHIQGIMDEKKADTKSKEDILPRTIFHTLLDSSLPKEDKSLERLGQEAQLIIGAGTDTTANVLTQSTFHILNNPQVVSKLRAELEAAIPDPYAPLKLTHIEQLPYLTAVMQEAIRLAYGISSRLVRIATEEDLIFGDYVIPRGTPVGMTSILLHHNETNFPDSYKFIPERWLGEAGKALEKYMVSFTRGSRQCIGMNLAKAELYLTLATVFRRYDMQLFDAVRERDIDVVSDGFLPQPSPDARVIRVLLKK